MCMPLHELCLLCCCSYNIAGYIHSPSPVLQSRHTAESNGQLQPLQQAAKKEPCTGHQPRLNRIANTVLGQAPPRQEEYPVDRGPERSRDNAHSRGTHSRQQKRPTAEVQVGPGAVVVRDYLFCAGCPQLSTAPGCSRRHVVHCMLESLTSCCLPL